MKLNRWYKNNTFRWRHLADKIDNGESWHENNAYYCNFRDIRWCNYTILICALAHVSLLTKCCNNDSPIIPMNTPNCVLFVTRPVGVRSPDWAHYLVKNLALYITDCVSLCLSDETLKAVGPFYVVSMPGEVKYPTSLHWRYVTCVDSTF